MSAAAHRNRLAVAHLATEIEAETIVEIGVRRGRQSKMFLKVPTCETLYLIDPWTPDGRVNEHGMNKNARSVKRWSDTRGPKAPTVYVMRAFSSRAVTAFEDESIDFLYIDGDHSTRAVTEDIQNYLPKVRIGGIICGDDYVLPAVKKAVDRLIPDLQLVPDTRIWWMQKWHGTTNTGF